MQLDSISEPGVSERVFQQMFSRCRICQMYMTKRTIPFHSCEDAIMASNVHVDVEIIDLTNED